MKRRENPIDPNTRILLMGTALVGTAVGIAAILLAKKAGAATPPVGTSVFLSASDANTMQAVTVGQTVMISLEANASQGYGWLAATVTPAGILGAPTRQSSATGVTDSYPVIAPGSVAVSYLETTPSTSVPTVFNLTAAAAQA